MAGRRVGRKACARAGLTACRGGGAGIFAGTASLLAGVYGIGAIVVDGHLGALCPAGGALHGAAADGGHQQGDQVLPVGQLQSLDHLFGVAGLVVLQQCALQRLALGGLFHKYRLEGVGVKAGIEHTGAHGAGGGVEVLHLLGHIADAVEVLREHDRVVERRAGVRAHHTVVDSIPSQSANSVK